MKKLMYAVYGASGCGRGVMPLARAQLASSNVERECLVFIDDFSDLRSCNGHSVFTYERFLEVSAPGSYVVLAVANGVTRSNLAQKCELAGIRPWTINSSNNVFMDEIRIGVGAILSPFVTMTSNISIGKHFHANLYSYVEHDCVIGDFVTFAPGVKCNGNIVIEDYAYIGSGAVIKQGQPDKPLKIGKHAVIGMGAVVTRDVPAGTTVVGNPARPMVIK